MKFVSFDPHLLDWLNIAMPVPIDATLAAITVYPTDVVGIEGRGDGTDAGHQTIPAPILLVIPPVSADLGHPDVAAFVDHPADSTV
jgi:hypothetical protein